MTEAELRLMNVLWERGSSTVHEIVQALPAGSPLAYNSVLTTIRILEQKGYVKHGKDGRAHVYVPTVGRNDATRLEIRHLVQRFFSNSHELLVLNLLQDEALDAEELKRMRSLLEKKGANGGD